MGAQVQALDNHQRSENLSVKVLLLEDNEVDAMWVKRGLKKAASSKYEVAVLQKIETLNQFLARNMVDVIIVDLNLPDSQGARTVKDIANTRPGTPIVVLSGQADFDTMRDALLAGAQTFQVKDMGSEETLAERIDFAIRRKYREIELAKKFIASPL